MIEKSDFYNQATLDVFDGNKSKKASRILPVNLWSVAYRKLTFLNRAYKLEHLKIPPSNRLEKLSGNRKGQHSIRINDQYRVCFIWEKSKPTRIEITDYHS